MPAASTLVLFRPVGAADLRAGPFPLVGRIVSGGALIGLGLAAALGGRRLRAH